MPRSLTRPTAATSTVSPSMTAFTNTGSVRRSVVAPELMEAIASTRLAVTSRNFIAISSAGT